MSRRARPTTFGGRLAGRAERLERHPLALGIIVLVVIAIFSYLSVVAINGVPFSNPHRVRAIVPTGAAPLKDGDEVRIAGQRAGQLRAVEPAPNADGAEITMDVDQAIGRDATATVRLRGLAGATYVEIHPGDTKRPLPEDGLIPIERTNATVELVDVIDAFDLPTREAMSRTLERYGGGLDGRGRDVNAMLGDLPLALEGTLPILRGFDPQPGALSGMLRGLRGTARGLAAPGRADLAPLITGAADTLSVTADHSRDLQDTIAATAPLGEEARTTLPLADATLRETEDTVVALEPVVARLGDSLPAVNRLLGERAGLAAVRPLSERALPVLRQARPLLVELRFASGLLAPLAGPLGRFSAYLARYGDDIFTAPDGFTRWGGFRYPDGQAAGHRAVRFAPVFTCMRARDAYPEPLEARSQQEPCER